MIKNWPNFAVYRILWYRILKFLLYTVASVIMWYRNFIENLKNERFIQMNDDIMSRTLHESRSATHLPLWRRYHRTKHTRSSMQAWSIDATCLHCSGRAGMYKSVWYGHYLVQILSLEFLDMACCRVFQYLAYFQTAPIIGV